MSKSLKVGLLSLLLLVVVAFGYYGYFNSDNLKGALIGRDMPSLDSTCNKIVSKMSYVILPTNYVPVDGQGLTPKVAGYLPNSPVGTFSTVPPRLVLASGIATRTVSGVVPSTRITGSVLDLRSYQLCKTLIDQKYRSMSGL